MAFINEYIPEADLKKYDFERLNRRETERSGTTPARHWTIDREADIWLRTFYVEMDHTAPLGGFTGISVWDFYWKGHLMLVKVKDVAGGGGHGKPRWARKKALSINIAPEAESHRHQIIGDLEVAFTAYKGAGVFATNDSLDYSFTLEI